MTPPAGSLQAFHRVLTEDLRQPVYLTPDDVRGGWREVFPDLAACLPAPYPIFGSDEERIITYGYPILISDGIWKIRHELEKLVDFETDYRLARAIDGLEEKDQVMLQRDRYLRSISTVIENVLMNDYGRGLLEVFLLFHSGDVVRALGQVAKQAQLRKAELGRETIEELRLAIVGVFADIIQRAALTAVGRLKQLADAPTSMRMSPLLTVLCQDQLLLAESRPPAEIEQLSGYLKTRFRLDAQALVTACMNALNRLREVVRRYPEIGSLLSTAGTSRLRFDQPRTMLEPSLLDALTAANLVAQLELSPEQVKLFRELGRRLKTCELLATLRRRIRPMERQGSQLMLTGASSATAIAPSTRPFDFASPGVVESLVRRCGLVYDLTNFTATLEEVRKEGQAAEEKALQFMYVFQSRLEEIRQKRVLNFEKFLGDGALYSSRRAIRVLVAACEIQLLYDNLRDSGFPFDQGIRMALNFGTYRLLPMLLRGGETLRFEFFGHGIVELARLTTGKSTREVDEIAEFLVHAGYDPSEVDSFLAPLAEARSGHGAGGARRYTANIDNRGELINEGMVVTLPFLDELEQEMDEVPVGILDFDELKWAVMPVEPRDTDSLHVGFRYLGVARLKGLAPQELVEAVVWSELPGRPEATTTRESLIEILRRLDYSASEEIEDEAGETIPEDLVVVTYLQEGDQRDWVFGEYRHSDDVVLHAVQIPLQTPELDPNEPLETWLFRNRFELARLYEGIRRENPGLSTPLETLRSRNGFLACYLAAPHRAPG